MSREVTASPPPPVWASGLWKAAATDDDKLKQLQEMAKADGAFGSRCSEQVESLFKHFSEDWAELFFEMPDLDAPSNTSRSAVGMRPYDVERTWFAHK